MNVNFDQQCLLCHTLLVVRTVDHCSPIVSTVTLRWMAFIASRCIRQEWVTLRYYILGIAIITARLFMGIIISLAQFIKQDSRLDDWTSIARVCKHHGRLHLCVGINTFIIIYINSAFINQALVDEKLNITLYCSSKCSYIMFMYN